jgi:hypothetical protein
VLSVIRTAGFAVVVVPLLLVVTAMLIAPPLPSPR